MSQKKRPTKIYEMPSKGRSASPPDDRERGLWIDPDIWRRIKGEGGRSGVEGLPSTNRYLDYADIDLGQKKMKARARRKA